jgi:AraC family transcriptional regulator
MTQINAQPRIEILKEKKLVGKCVRTSLANDQTKDLWSGFMSARNKISNPLGTELYAVRVYDQNYFLDFNPANEFDKWASAEVNDFNNIPEGMEKIVLPEGMYAVFLYKGAASAGGPFFQYIYGIWLQDSDYLLDERPHFEILGEKYRNEDPSSEEEIWIPVKQRN